MRLGKRERAWLAGKANKRRAVVKHNLKRSPQDTQGSMRETTAYSPPTERLSLYGRGRVMHNLKGSELREADKRKLFPPRFS